MTSAPEAQAEQDDRERDGDVDASEPGRPEPGGRIGPGKARGGPRIQSWNALKIRVRTTSPSFQWNRGDRRRAGAHPEVEGPGHHQFFFFFFFFFKKYG